MDETIREKLSDATNVADITADASQEIAAVSGSEELQDESLAVWLETHAGPSGNADGLSASGSGAGLTRTGLASTAAAEGLANNLLNWLKTDIDRQIASVGSALDKVDLSNRDYRPAAFGQDLPARQFVVDGAEPVQPRLIGDPAHDAMIYRAYIGKMEATLSQAFGQDFATSDDAKASAWRGLRREFWQETSEATLATRYKSGSSSGAVRDQFSPEALKGRLGAALLDKSGLSQKKSLLNQQSTSALSTLRIVLGVRDGLGIQRNVAVLNDPNASADAKLRAGFEISRQSGALLQVVGGVTVDALRSFAQGEGLLTPLKSNLQDMAKTAKAGMNLDVIRGSRPTAAQGAMPLGDTIANLTALDADIRAAQTRTSSPRAVTAGKSALSMIAGLTGIANDMARVATSDGDVRVIVQSSLGMVSTATQTASELTSIAAAAKSGTTASKLAGAGSALGVGASVFGVAAGTVGLVGAIKNLEQNPNSTAAKWAVANSGVQIAASAFAGVAAVLCPPAALLTLLIPDFGGIGRALELVEHMADFEARGLMHEWEVLKKLHTIAALDATPLVNWTSAIYTPALNNEMRAKMDTEWYWGAYGERANNLMQDSSDYAKSLQSIVSASQVNELISIFYDREQFNWFGDDRQLFGTAMGVYKKDGHRDDFAVERGNAINVTRAGAVKDGQVDRVLVIDSNLPAGDTLPDQQAIQGEWKTKQVWKWTNDFLWWGSEKWVDERYEDVRREKVEQGPSVTLNLDGDNEILVRAANSRVTSVGDSNDTYCVIAGVDCDIDDQAGDSDRLYLVSTGSVNNFNVRARGIESIQGSSSDDVLNISAVSGAIDLGAGEDTLNLVDVRSGSIALTASAAGTQVTQLDPVSGAHVSEATLKGVEIVRLSDQDDCVSLSADAVATTGEGTTAEIVSLELAELDAGKGNDTIVSLASSMRILGGDGNDIIVIGSGDIGAPPLRDVRVIAGAGDDIVNIAGDAQVRVELGEGSDRISAASQSSGWIEIADITGGGAKQVELGAADAIFRLDSGSHGTVDVTDSAARAFGNHGLSFDFAGDNADSIILTAMRDKTGVFNYGIETADARLKVSVQGSNLANTSICVADQAYAMDRAMNQLTQQMASMGQGAGSLQLSVLPAEMHTPISSLSLATPMA
ncbi:MAG: calcium-binding protein [Chelatococcus sp.]|uniref:calcium-binding protein n=1 Tax=Chelatococcus sp. TaxID=1953771 RepID=UPI0025C6CBFC|nr:calcium-binding protein [Chelatococcus sp.]MBX3539971.1 calcium-binding protein [Chelatococcus sp.]